MVDIEKLKELALAATPGPWRECGHDRGGCSCGQIWSTVADMPVAQSERGDEEIGKIPEHIVKANARFIATACPATVLALIAEVERLRARFEYIEDRATTEGGGQGFTVKFFVPVDSEDIGCGIDAAIAASKEKA